MNTSHIPKKKMISQIAFVAKMPITRDDILTINNTPYNVNKSICQAFSSTLRSLGKHFTLTVDECMATCIANIIESWHEGHSLYLTSDIMSAQEFLKTHNPFYVSDILIHGNKILLRNFDQFVCLEGDSLLFRGNGYCATLINDAIFCVVDRWLVCVYPKYFEIKNLGTNNIFNIELIENKWIKVTGREVAMITYTNTPSPSC